MKPKGLSSPDKHTSKKNYKNSLKDWVLNNPKCKFLGLPKVGGNGRNRGKVRDGLGVSGEISCGLHQNGDSRKGKQKHVRMDN